MINFVTALSCEANPLIKLWGLKKIQTWQPYPVFASNDARLVISGVGRNNSAAATAWLAGLSVHSKAIKPEHNIWINIGIAGHLSHAVGTMAIAHKISERATGHCWYPCQLQCAIASENIETSDQPVTDYAADTLHEMEASGFYSTALRFSTAELIQSIKVVSDNSENPLTNIDENMATALISDNLQPLQDYCSHLEALQRISDPVDTDHSESLFLPKWNFSVTQQRKLQRLLQRHAIILGELTELPPELCNIKSTTQVLNTLETLLNQSPTVLNGPTGND